MPIPLNLAELSARVGNCKFDEPIYLVREDEPARCITGLISWRGVYSQLSINSFPPLDNRCEKVETMLAGEFKKECEEAVGKSFEGYKGGEFKMSFETLVYADEIGSYEKFATYSVCKGEGFSYVKAVRVRDI